MKGTSVRWPGESVQGGGRRTATKLIWAATTGGAGCGADLGWSHAGAYYDQLRAGGAGTRRLGRLAKPTRRCRPQPPQDLDPLRRRNRLAAPPRQDRCEASPCNCGGFPSTRPPPVDAPATPARRGQFQPLRADRNLGPLLMHSTPRGQPYLTPQLMGCLLDDSLGAVDKLKLCTTRRLAWPDIMARP